ncbi:MAG: antitoxin Xre/MbcA/ParS toxin-binding domain-containing protein [Steroidobacteraceae bacterium]
MDALPHSSRQAEPSATLTKAVVRAVGFLGLSQAALADVLGVSPATASRIVAGGYTLQPARKREWEFALLFVRLFRSLDAIVGNDRDAQSWLRDHNRALAARPLDLIRSAEGLIRVLHYLDASRGRV